MVVTQILAHRGFSSQYPENTMAAFQAAIDIGADGIEFDVQLTKDHVAVVIHDLTLERTTTGTGFVRQHTASELKELSAGAWFSEKFKEENIPTLEEVLIWAKNHKQSFTLNVEVKGRVEDRDLALKTILPLIRNYKMEDRIIVSSFDHKTVCRFNEQAPFIETAVIVMAALYKPEDYLRQMNVLGYHFSFVSLLEEEIQSLLKKGFRLRPYTVNDEKGMKRFIELGCDAIFTDEVQKALEIRDKCLKEVRREQ
ncbi:glycerophosphodiester phosphodiesterase [Halalkalibacter akibai]|uniref:Glycerophosphoryl diester phosphodiesterase n=1 Tax=Halalkalibacter akibai (strain ATCC 43226 / DSM 21942 / CIP 109018 / JCM 9157 / 1139) TaxID=1236973 RepID=W4QU61_HALA3|nr:glycerophosphodiester phosphodiesterase [Halalkalibacter akibai]GAE35621.1 glycerophosphoryl diester phosphodiesterase [Halalkalibacter akibai JCM 9157]